MARTDLSERADGLRAERTPYVLATVVRAQRPTSAKAGDRALVLADGTIEGFVGGTCAESTVRLHGLRLLRSGESTLLRITPDEPLAETAGDDGTGAGTEGEGLVTVGNPCLSGGTLDIFLEAVLPPPLVYVFGAAPVARALATVGAALGYAVTATVDPAEPIPTDAAAVVIASHGRDEEPVLTAALAGPVGYVGLVASRRRGTAVLAGLDLPDTVRTRVHTPAGLDIGARTATEVALSVLAEIILDQTNPVRRGPPHSRVTGGMLEQNTPPVAAAVPVRPAGGGRPDSPIAESPGDETIGEAVDPVCGMTVAVSGASLRVEHGGRTWYFCGTGCRQAFVDDPSRYTP